MAELKQHAVGDKKSEKPAGKRSSKSNGIVKGIRHSYDLKPGEKKKAPARVKKRVPSVFDEESEVIAKAVEVIGDKSEAMRWMGTPVRTLDYSTPVSLLGTRRGRQLVIVALGRLEHGVL